MKLRISDGYLEIKTEEDHQMISLPYLKQTIYGTPEIISIVNKYHYQRETPFDWPNMFWDPVKEVWLKVLKTDSAEYKAYELDSFIQMCRRNQNVS